MAKKKGIIIPEAVMTKALMLDCREEGDIRKLKQFLNKLPFVKSEEDLHTDNLEKIIAKLETKSTIRLSYIMRSHVEGKELYSSMLKGNTPEVDGKWLKTIHSISIWEALAKTAFYMYYHIKSEQT